MTLLEKYVDDLAETPLIDRTVKDTKNSAKQY